MECAARQAASARLLQILSKPRHSPHHQLTITSRHQQSGRSLRRIDTSLSSRRYASNSSSSSSASKAPPKSKPIVLEKPDKFRPPSHSSKRNARSTTSMYGGGAAYNQGMNAAERASSSQKSYPHMFPNEGTRMHWFLTTRWVHVAISMAILITLAFTSLISTWSKTSPYAHLIPPIKMALFSPLTYVSELFSVYRLHLEYTTQQTAEKRRQGILDAQKRRLYRRAHGMEDLNADEVSGPDVRGLVEWDDGLTNRERERGGQYATEMIRARMQEGGQLPGEELGAFLERKRTEETERVKLREAEKRRKDEEEERREEERLARIGAKKGEDQPRRKLWLGIW